MKRLCSTMLLLLLMVITNISFATESGIVVKEDRKQKEKLPDALIEEWRISPSPANDNEVITNPPALLWASEKHWHNKDVLYKVYLSQDKNFPEDKTIVGKNQRFCFYNPHKKLEPGNWYWKYDIIENEKATSNGVYSFIVGADATVFETPDFDELMNQISTKHPRVMNQGKDINEIRKKAPKHPMYSGIIESGESALQQEIYRGPVGDKDPAVAKAISRITGKEVAKFHHLLEAYVLSGNEEMLDALLERTNVFLTWPTNDLLGSQVLTALSQGYDVLFDELDESVKKAMLDVIANQLQHGLEKWPGVIESRHVENHFWQMEISGNFVASLATIHDLELSKEMLEYTYELFIARFPNLATQEGGWAEGLGYFGVNKRAIVDMALLLKKVGGVDVFQMNWYKNLADYFLYYAPVDGRISGFGDMHDRVGYGNVGHSMMLTTGMENNDEKALYRLSALMKSKKGMHEHESWIAKELERVEPWYQVVNDIYFDPSKIAEPEMESARLFKGVGLAALHTDVLNSSTNTAVYFRSSPFGAKGHMHANQNCFNLSRKGEPIFYSTGYYTTFADPHSLTSYRHTRAHNSILVNGCGQAFGHEGYGYIKRFINGENISYVCGDATKAYRKTVDKQFIELNEENGISQTPEFGFADSKLKMFERHVIFLRPDVVVIYDVLEYEKPSDWAFLLHTMKKPTLNKNGLLTYETELNRANAFVIGSSKLSSNITNQFFSPAIDIKKKYKSIPNQYHITYNTENKSKGMRFLAVIQLGDAGQKIEKVKQLSDGHFVIGDITITAELDATKPESLSVITENGKLFINDIPESYTTIKSQNTTLLVEKKKGESVISTCGNMLPNF